MDLKIVNWERYLVEENLPLTKPPSASGHAQASPELEIRLPEDVGFLLVGHGTRKSAGQEQFKAVFSQFKHCMEGFPTELSFLELAAPDIPAGVQRLAEAGVRNLVTVPVLLFSAGHALQDIPEAVSAACREFGVNSYAQSGPFQSEPAVMDLSARRFRQAACRILPKRPTLMGPDGVCDKDCLAKCSGKYCSRTALLMIGRGSNSPEATAQMRAFTERRVEQTRVDWWQTCFVHGQKPTVDEGLDALESQPHELKIVQPHLIFEGLLIDQIRRQVTERQQRDPTKRWVVAPVLGTDEHLALTLRKLAMSCLPSAEHST